MEEIWRDITSEMLDGRYQISNLRNVRTMPSYYMFQGKKKPTGGKILPIYIRAKCKSPYVGITIDGKLMKINIQHLIDDTIKYTDNDALVRTNCNRVKNVPMSRISELNLT
jgi:hypothetical protein